MDIGGTSGKHIPSNKVINMHGLSLFCFLYTTHSHFRAWLFSRRSSPCYFKTLPQSYAHSIDLTAPNTDSKPASFPLLSSSLLILSPSYRCSTRTQLRHSAFINVTCWWWEGKASDFTENIHIFLKSYICNRSARCVLSFMCEDLQHRYVLIIRRSVREGVAHAQRQACGEEKDNYY